MAYEIIIGADEAFILFKTLKKQNKALKEELDALNDERKCMKIEIEYLRKYNQILSSSACNRKECQSCIVEKMKEKNNDRK